MYALSNNNVWLRSAAPRRDPSLKLNVALKANNCKPDIISGSPAADTEMSSPRPVFHNMVGKGRGGGGGGPGSNGGSRGSQDTSCISPQHEELVRFHTEWYGRVCKEMEMSGQNGHCDNRGIIRYQEKEVHPALENFVAFDLEAYWGKRIYQNLTQQS